MTDDRIAALEAEVARLTRAAEFEAAIDARLEVALIEREPLERVVPDLLRLFCAKASATDAAVATLDESLTDRVFASGEWAPSARDIEMAEGGAEDLSAERAVVVAQRLDVAGAPFGVVFARFDSPPRDEARGLLGLLAEQLDNHLAAVAQARRKYEVIRAISDALKEPVLDRGIARAIEILEQWVGFEDLVLLFRHEDDLEGGALRYTIFKNGERQHDSAEAFDADVDAFVRAHARSFLAGKDEEIRERFGIRRYREEVLITGVRTARVVGRLIVTSRHGEFHTYDRELLERFADYLRQRIVDFNREWKQLSVVFNRAICERLLGEEGYVDRWLRPREAHAAILYCDIAGFTRVSEGILRKPEAIGRLIDTWSEAAVKVLWETGGAFDKMVGDCIIGLWGAPFFEDSPAERCAAALEAARRISVLTRELTSDPALPELATLTEPLDVATGLNFCPISVGLFGPNDDYTGFSSGMNNTARLQGVARSGEILCMDTFVEALGEGVPFSEERAATVKNVADPLRFRAFVEPAP